MEVSMTEARILFEMGTTQPQAIRFMYEGADSAWCGITWGEFLGRATQIALYLHDIGIGPQRKVAVFARNRIEWPFCVMAIHACRGVLVPIYQANTPIQTQYILHHSDSEVLVTELELLPVLFRIWRELPMLRKVIVLGLPSADQLEKHLEDFNRTSALPLKPADVTQRLVSINDVYDIGESLRRHQPGAFEQFCDTITKDDVSSVLYTSGTTGQPKGVTLTIDNLYTNAGDWIEVLGPLIPETRVDLLWLPMSHIFGLGELGLGNTLGFTTYFTTPQAVLGHMSAVCPTVFMSVPAYWEKLYLDAVGFSDQRSQQIDRLHVLTGGRLKFCLSGGAGLKTQVKEFFYDAGLLIIEGYGLTECSPTLTMNRRDDFDFDTVGKPFPNVQLQLAPDGEILAKGPNVFRQYYKDEAATAEAFDAEGWFKTGDLGTFTQRGFLKIIGRKKDIIVTSGGKNISPQAIESQFLDDPYIEHIVLYGDERKYLTALITLKAFAVMAYAARAGIIEGDYSALVRRPEVAALVQKAVDAVNANLSSVETIKRLYIHDRSLSVEDGLLTPSFKLKRRQVHERFRDVLDGLYQ
ncbi:long-chain fatty-acid-CoA ligase [Candidatus Magnetobacterium bavaricum]|uniref:Long-chain fatty-acid-CoA ligase n=1 Tax=Candidatus Magnetobacterium bavaricum TaxID=29290 RepID=A0A0F3GS53_9BACT|nr:long-chain fatty-acid-CoA ligase [Candidatus Magnetobacterium bavaricum]